MSVMGFVYKKVIKPVLFGMDPEDVHNRVTRLGVMLGRSGVYRGVVRAVCSYEHPSLQNTVAGIAFKNPVGLAAGFDKNAQLYDILPEVGFGFAELGSVTGEACEGNPKPRLFRLPQERSILVNYGLCSRGSLVISRQLAKVKFRMPVGLSVAKTNDPTLSTDEGIEDYRVAYRRMHSFGAYTTINVSCPNTADGQTFGHPSNLKPLLKVLARERHVKPVFLKIKPDMSLEQLSEIVQIVNEHSWVTGFIVSNLTTQRDGLKTSKEKIDAISVNGGLSGLPVQQKSNKSIRCVRKITDKVIIGCGGVFTGKDAYEKIRLGASLVQLVTAMIYDGPTVVSEINKELVELMHEDGYGMISEVIAEVRG